MKKCNHCGCVKPLDEFYREVRKWGAVYVRAQCIPCYKKISNDYYRNNREKALAKVKERNDKIKSNMIAESFKRSQNQKTK